MGTAPPEPTRFFLESRGPDLLYARSDLLEGIKSAGLADFRRWEDLLARGRGGAGRGGTARLELPGGSRVILKKMRRGGLAGGVWRDHFLGSRRLLANLTVSGEAAHRGIATPAPVALLLRRRGSALFQAWLGVEEIEGSRDLLSMLRRGQPSAEVMTAAIFLVRRMHDAGLHHRDLNLGNLLLRRSASGEWEAFVVDLDRAALRPGPLPFGARLRALRRLERSYVKHFGRQGPLGADGGRVWYGLYAGDDETLARRLEACGRVGKVWLAIHRLGWKR